MKIGIYTPYLDTLTGGEKYILSMAACLAKEHEVSLFWDPKDEESLKYNAQKKLGIDISNISFVSNIFSSSVSVVSRLLRSKRYDKIIFLSDGSIPVVSCGLILHFQFPVEWVDGRLIKTQLKLKRVEKILCNSEFTKELIDKKFTVSSDVLYPPVEIKEVEIEKENVILNVGRFGQHVEGVYFKKQDVLIQAFKKMIDGGFKNWKLVFVISVAERDNERFELLRKLGSDYPIEFIVNPSNEKLWEAYGRAKIYWHASGFGEDIEKHPEKAEHFGISTVEAMGAGAVPIVIHAGGQMEIVENRKSGFLWNSIEELIGYTQIISEEKDVWEVMSKSAQARALVFSSDKFYSKLRSLI